MNESLIHRLLGELPSQPSVSTDTRTLRPGDWFFALSGPRFNGNAYAAEALAKGAARAIVDDPAMIPPGDARYVLCEDVLATLQALATARRRTWACPVLGITGSNGKTSTKELVFSVLLSEKKAFATRGNLNNHIGVPLTLLAAPPGMEVAVIEMGANKPGDIAELAAIAEPTHGFITNVGYAHIEQLGGLDGVRVTKGALFDFVAGQGGTIFVNALDVNVVKAAGDYARQVRLGPEGADYGFRLLENQLDGMLLELWSARWESSLRVRTQLTGAYNAMNVLAAAAIGSELGVSREGIRAGLERYVPENNRSQLVKRGNYTLWLDAYNANPSSMRASIQNAFTMQPQPVTLILGDMLELGPAGPQMHEELGDFIRSLRPALVIGIGPLMRHLTGRLPGLAHHFGTVEEAAAALEALLGKGGFILLKGSRSIGVERLVAAIPGGEAV